jgi:dTDP-4-amino-4,6-dideoxygalactose transaminase
MRTTSGTGRSAMHGGTPAFPDGLPLARPTVPNPAAVAEELRKVLESGVLTNGPKVEELEHQVAEYTGVRHAVAVSSCTAGLMLVLRVSDLSGDVVVPSFTFAATAHAVAWNDLRPAFTDINPETLTLSVDCTARAIGVRTAAIMATHTYGTPADVDRLTDVARRAGIKLFFDAAHALGSRHQDRSMGGFGDAEVFSLTPTKPVVAGEGGIITTNDDAMAEGCRLGRDYAKEPDYDCRFVGLNARMSELHATVGLASFQGIEERIAERNRIAELYMDALAAVPGISFPLIREGDRSTYKDFTILVDADAFGMAASRLADALGLEGVETRRYYSPPVHRMKPYRGFPATNGGLSHTEAAADRVLTLPLWVGMTDEHVARLADAVTRIRARPVGRPRRPKS